MYRKILGVLAAGLVVGVATTGAIAQDNSPFGGFKHDRSAPIDITSNSLEVRQAEQLAIFEGEVIAGQDTLRLTADRVEVIFDEEAEGGDDGTGSIKNLKAKGNVFISNGAETAQGNNAEYDLETGMVTMTGNVVLTQGRSAGSGQTLVINLNTGVARMEGSGEGRPSLSFVANNAPKQAKKPECTPEQAAGAAELGIKCVPLDSTN